MTCSMFRWVDSKLEKIVTLDVIIYIILIVMVKPFKLSYCELT